MSLPELITTVLAKPIFISVKTVLKTENSLCVPHTSVNTFNINTTMRISEMGFIVLCSLWVQSFHVDVLPAHHKVPNWKARDFDFGVHLLEELPSLQL
jgi:hypothetical protein